MNELPSPEQLFEMEYQSQLKGANHLNQQALLDFLSRKDSWLENAPIRVALGLPQEAKPVPRSVITVVAHRAEPRSVETLYEGAGLVADPTVELPIPPPPPPKPANVAQLGIQVGFRMFACGPDDTMPYNRDGEPGITVEINGKKYVKVGCESAFGPPPDRMIVFYRQVA
jgi:hypothetical protein